MNLIKENATQAYKVEGEKYSLAAVAQYNFGGKVTAINSGTVRRKDNGSGSVSFSASLNGGPMMAVATQSDTILDNLSVQFSGVKQGDQASILGEIKAFIKAIVADITGETI